MSDIFLGIERALESPSVEETINLTRQTFQQLQADADFVEPADRQVKGIEQVCFPAKPICVNPRDLPRRRLGSDAGKSSFIHSIAHIEFNAIKLALDIAYRFKGLPVQFYRDWLFVANDECKHFELLNNRLATYGCEYGDLPSHDGLWSMAVKTDEDIMARLSLVPRYLEARGLDVTPAMVEKLKAQKEMASAAVLELILEEEVTHVAHGTKWLDYVCEQFSLQRENVYFENINHYMKGQILGPFNRALRLRAGFSEAELTELERLDKRR